MKMIGDKRKIDSLTIGEEIYEDCRNMVCAGSDKTIKPYYERGDLLWFIVIKDDVVIQRINGKYVSQIWYSEEKVSDG